MASVLPMYHLLSLGARNSHTSSPLHPASARRLYTGAPPGARSPGTRSNVPLTRYALFPVAPAIVVVAAAAASPPAPRAAAASHAAARAASRRSASARASARTATAGWASHLFWG